MRRSPSTERKPGSSPRKTNLAFIFARRDYALVGSGIALRLRSGEKSKIKSRAAKTGSCRSRHCLLAALSLCNSPQTQSTPLTRHFAYHRDKLSPLPPTSGLIERQYSCRIRRLANGRDLGAHL